MLTQQLSPLGAGTKTLVDLLHARAVTAPYDQGYIFLEDGQTPGPTLTWSALEREVRTLGAHLRTCSQPGDRALLLYPPGLAFVSAFFACLYAGVIAVPVPLPSRRRIGRLQAIVQDSAPRLALTTTAELPAVSELSKLASGGGELIWLATDQLTVEARGWSPAPVTPTALAFLQYTSGSTAVPKGVMVSHSNLLHNLSDLDQGWHHTHESVIVTWLPTFHDMGLIYGVLFPLYKGVRCYMLAPAAFLQRPLVWLAAISRYGASHSIAPNFAYDLCVRKTVPQERAGLDLRSWTTAVNGAEPIRSETLDRFTAAFMSSGFQATAHCPGYGLAEATLKVAAAQPGVPPTLYHIQAAALEQHRIMDTAGPGPAARTLVGCGRPALGTQVIIVDPATRTLVPTGQVGEIWVAGPSIAQGYWQRPAETAATFRATLADTETGPYLRTGDLGFLRDGELFITGRHKDLIIIDGRNHYPQDIESTVESSHPAIRPGCSAAFGIEQGGRERVVVVAEADLRAYKAAPIAIGGSIGQEIVRAIRRAVLEEHDIGVQDVGLLKPAHIPKTSSGKIQRHACRASYLAGTLERVEV